MCSTIGRWTECYGLRFLLLLGIIHHRPSKTQSPPRCIPILLRSESGLTTPLDRSAYQARLNQLVADSLIVAKRTKFDVFNALSLMDNALFLKEQKFGPGDGMSHYYLFNYWAKPVNGGVDENNQLDEKMLSGVGFVNL